MRLGEHNSRGFTLIELLIAISVMAMIAVLGWRGLDGIVRARAALNDDLEQTRGLQLSFAQMQSDCAKVVASQDIGRRPAMAAEPNRIVLVRWVYAEGQPSRVQIVTYRVADGRLTRRETTATRDLAMLDVQWQAALQDRDNSPPVLLQSDVSAMMVQTWLPGQSGPVVSTAATPGGDITPAGVEVSLQLRNRPNSMTKLFLVGPV
jgi:general secretion pathway protein J